MRRQHACWYFLLALTAATSLPAADSPALNARQRNKARAMEFDAANKALAADTHIWVRHGVIADRNRRTVRIAAETIRLGLGKPVEFPLIAENSGKDYEALAVSFATPSDIHAALLFLGFPAGQSVDPSATRFWPKGERVRLTFQYEEPAGGSNRMRTASASELILDNRSGKTLPDDGFIFTGSRWVRPPDWEGGTGMVYAADVFSPNCIASVYNESTSVLDVPRRAPQHEVYSHLVPNPDLQLPDASFAVVSLQPFDPPGHRRVKDAALHIRPAAGATQDTADGLAWRLDDAGLRESGNTLGEITNVLARWIAAGQDPYVGVTAGDGMTVAQLHRMAGWLERLEDQGWMRIDPPPEGHPFYKSFLPDERHRNRKDRPVQPWEAYVRTGGAGVTGELVCVEEEWQPEGEQPVYRETRYPLAAEQDIPGLLARHKDAPAVVLVFAEPTLSYGALRPFLTPFLKRNMIVYVFPNP